MMMGLTTSTEASTRSSQTLARGSRAAGARVTPLTTPSLRAPSAWAAAVAVVWAGTLMIGLGRLRSAVGGAAASALVATFTRSEIITTAARASRVLAARLWRRAARTSFLRRVLGGKRFAGMLPLLSDRPRRYHRRLLNLLVLVTTTCTSGLAPRKSGGGEAVACVPAALSTRSGTITIPAEASRASAAKSWTTVDRTSSLRRVTDGR
mmetsp:Transcript_42460/g.117149  ORF Transcript_42460/g.117149 Transcript_42460/m.117149 type:complete len:208 (+) Transcript_42460:146-769(+)